MSRKKGTFDEDTMQKICLALTEEERIKLIKELAFDLPTTELSRLLWKREIERSVMT